METKANSQLIKRLNEVRLLNLLREESPISRNELARRTKISKVAISDIISRLDESGFILEVGKGESTRKGGKRPTLLKLNPENGFVIGMEIKRTYAKLSLANIESQIMGIEEIFFEAGSSVNDVLTIIFAGIDALFARTNLPPEKLISIGIGIPGFVDYTRGELKYADTLRGWANQPLVAPFYSRYNVPVILENDVNTIALGESLLGAGRGTSNLVCIWVGEGVGAGIIMDGQLVRGESGNAGEIGYIELGHLIADTGKLPNLYSNQRYFGELVSEANLLDALRIKLQWQGGRRDARHADSPIEELLAEGDRRNASIQELLDQFAYAMAVLCINLIKTVNPSLLILSGKVIENSAYLLEKVRHLVKQSMVAIPFQSSTIVVSQLKGEACIKGAIELALQTIFEPPYRKRKHHSPITASDYAPGS